MNLGGDTEALFEKRTSCGWKYRLRRLLEPPVPLVNNPREPRLAELGRWNLYLGGAGSKVTGFVNVDICRLPGVDVVGDAQRLPFPDEVFQHVECDAVLEHVRDPWQAMREIRRVTAAGGTVHVVTPFCHPFHAYPDDYWRFTLEGLKQLADGMEVLAQGWRTGPTATLLVMWLEYVKMLLPWRWWRVVAGGVAGWVVFPLRYLDLLFLRAPFAHRLGNHGYVWLRKVDGRYDGR